MNFIDNLKVDFQEDFGAFGHYPFQMLSKKGKKENYSALFLNGSVTLKYEKMKEQISNGNNEVLLSVDFPAKRDIENDFIAVFSYKEKKFDLAAITYCTETGEKLSFLDWKNSEHLTIIFNQFLSYMN